MRLFSYSVKEELLGGRSSSRSFFFFHFFFGFFGFFGFLGRFLLFFFHVSGRSSSRLSGGLGGVSGENNCGEGNGYENGNDAGQNFFHLYYLQKDLFNVFINAVSVPNQ